MASGLKERPEAFAVTSFLPRLLFPDPPVRPRSLPPRHACAEPHTGLHLRPRRGRALPAAAAAQLFDGVVALGAVADDRLTQHGAEVKIRGAGETELCEEGRPRGDLQFGEGDVEA